MKFNLEEVDSKWLGKVVAIGSVALAIAIVSLFVSQHQRSVQSIDIASYGIQSLYLDGDRSYLNPDISPALIKEVEAKVARVKGAQGKKMREQLQDAKVKLEAIDKLSTVYQSDKAVIVGEEVRGGLALQEDISEEEVLQFKEALPPAKDDPLLQTIHLELDQAESIFAELATTKKQLDQLPQELHQASIQEDIQNYLQVEESLEATSKHPQSQPLMKDYREKSQHYGHFLKEQMEYIEEEPELIDAIFSTDVLSEPLTGTRVDPRPLVALTFDDGPCQNTLEILEVLDDYDVQATFFQLGRYVEEYPGISKQVAEAGHKIGNHSYSHPDFNVISSEDIQKEINATQELIENATGVAPIMYRTPYGNGRSKMVELYPNLDPVYWNVDSEDWVSKDDKITVDHVMSQLQHRSIILMHDTQASTTEAIKELIPALKAEGYIFVLPSQIPEADSYRL